LDVVQVLSELQKTISTLQERQEKMLRALTISDNFVMEEQKQEWRQGKDNGRFRIPYLSEDPSHPFMGERKLFSLSLGQQAFSSGSKPAMPSEFDGNCSKGRAFLNSIQWYMLVQGYRFHDVTCKVTVASINKQRQNIDNCLRV
jgi:hypothetical protein